MGQPFLPCAAAGGVALRLLAGSGRCGVAGVTGFTGWTLTTGAGFAAAARCRPAAPRAAARCRPGAERSADRCRPRARDEGVLA